MIENLLAVWTAKPRSTTTSIVLPDGCRDLIVKTVAGEKPQWFVTSLYDQAKAVSLKGGSEMTGFRMKPGVRIEKSKLLMSVQNQYNDINEISCRLFDFTRRKHSVTDALDCLVSDVGSVAHAAKLLGNSQRTLQRLLIKETGRSPSYWLMLARIRKAARAVAEPVPLAEIADRSGYADQSHMSREFRRWFDISPSALRNKPEYIHQLNSSGYD